MTKGLCNTRPCITVTVEWTITNFRNMISLTKYSLKVGDFIHTSSIKFPPIEFSLTSIHVSITFIIQEVYLFYIKNLFILLSIYINNLMDFLYLMVPEMRQEKSNSNIWTFLFYIRLECNFCCKMIIFMIYWS
jgi:hypothetical protein